MVLEKIDSVIIRYGAVIFSLPSILIMTMMEVYLLWRTHSLIA
ncbi:hypothetical protein ACFLRC_04780 [Candidatus Altiarchaeota archaeon]